MTTQNVYQIHLRINAVYGNLEWDRGLYVFTIPGQAVIYTICVRRSSQALPSAAADRRHTPFLVVLVRRQALFSRLLKKSPRYNL